jgi:predicted lipid-binding transport protein (Tim44 family)
MGDDASIEIIFFAIVAAILCHRLWLVLGRRNDVAPPQRPDPFSPRASTSDAGRLAPPSPPVVTFDPSDPASLDAWIKRLKAVDPSFDERPFLDGAKSAFRMIVGAYANGDRATLKPLLGEDAYTIFDRAISERAAAGHTLETMIDRLSADIEEVRLAGTNARVTVGFRSTQTNILRAADGSVIEGDPKRTEDVLDIWVFARDTRSNDPNWTLIETRHQV